MRFAEGQNVDRSKADFVPREHEEHMRGVVILAAVSVIAIFLLVYLPSTASNKNLGALGAMMVVAIQCFYITYNRQQNIDLVMSTEFQNMLFAQSMAIGNVFCIIVRRDGTVVYANDSIKKIFPDYHYSRTMALDAVMHEGSVTDIDRKRLMTAIGSDTADSMVLPIKNKKEEEVRYVLSIAPLSRPAGYSFIAGREFQEPRTGTEMMPSILRATPAEKIDFMLQTCPVAHYTTDAFGRIEYVNHFMEKALEYEAGGLNNGNEHHRIDKLLFELDGKPIPDDYTLAEFKGPALFRKKAGNLLAVTMEQHLIRDPQGKLLGATGTLIPSSVGR